MVMDLQGKEHKKQKESTLRLFGQTIDIGQLKEKEKVRPKKDEKRNEDEREAKKPMEAVECPRCKSMDTKFCYFNNYNVNQPRHYCRKCQRYWTAGGALRNVPVGAGRRKQKPTFLPQNPPPFNSLFNPRPNPIPETLLPSRNPNPITTPRSKSYSPSFAEKTPSPQCHLSSSHSSSRSSFTLNFVNSGQSDWTLSCDENPATSSAFLPEKHLAKRTRIFLQSEEEDSSEGANSNPFSMDLDVAERALMRSDNMQKEVRVKCSEIVSYSLNSNPSKSNSSSLRVLC